MRLSKCPSCKKYNLTEKCSCKTKTESAHYKFLEIRSEADKHRKTS